MEKEEVFKVLDRAESLLDGLIDSTPDIKEAIWAGALINTAAVLFFKNGVSYEEYCQRLDVSKEVQKELWDRIKSDH